MNISTSNPGFKKRILKDIIFSFSIIIIISLMGGCGPSAGFLNVIPNDNNIEYQNKEYPLPDGSIINETEYTLPQSLKIQQIDYENSTDAVFIKYTDTKYSDEEHGFLLFNNEDNKTLWTAKTNMSYTLMRNNDLILKDPLGGKLYDAPSGLFVRDIEPYLVLADDRNTLMISPDTFALVDIHSGEKIWERPGHEWVGFRQHYIIEDRCYVVAEGLHSLELNEGTTWEYLTPTSFTNVGKEIAKEVALSCLFALAGGYNTSTYKPDITMNMNSDPLVSDDKVYFAARDKLVCLDKLTGKLIWESNIDPELESMSLYEISDNEIALVGKGMKILNYVYQKSDPPSIRIIQKNDGKITGVFMMDNEAIVQGFTSTDENLFLLTADQLLVFDKELKLLGISESTQEYGNFSNILIASDTLVIRTSKGLLGFSKETFSEVWFQYCELPPVDTKEEWIKPLFEKNKINEQSLYQCGFYWTPNETYGITAYDLSDGKEVAKVKLLSKNIKTFNDQYYIDFDSNKIKFISFKDNTELILNDMEEPCY